MGTTENSPPVHWRERVPQNPTASRRACPEQASNASASNGDACTKTRDIGRIGSHTTKTVLCGPPASVKGGTSDSPGPASEPFRPPGPKIMLFPARLSVVFEK
jgi:hypothetical protein